MLGNGRTSESQQPARAWTCPLLHAATLHAATTQGVLATLKTAACNSVAREPFAAHIHLARLASKCQHSTASSCARPAPPRHGRPPPHRGVCSILDGRRGAPRGAPRRRRRRLCRRHAARGGRARQRGARACAGASQRLRRNGGWRDAAGARARRSPRRQCSPARRGGRGSCEDYRSVLGVCCSLAAPRGAGRPWGSWGCVACARRTHVASACGWWGAAAQPSQPSSCRPACRRVAYCSAARSPPASFPSPAPSAQAA